MMMSGPKTSKTKIPNNRMDATPKTSKDERSPPFCDNNEKYIGMEGKIVTNRKYKPANLITNRNKSRLDI
jgi:hypothetical protein